MKFNFNLGAISCNDSERKLISCNESERNFAMDESSISIEMEPSELIECYKLEKELIPSIVSLIKEINNPSKSEDLKNLFKEEIKNEDEDEDEYNIYLH